MWSCAPTREDAPCSTRPSAGSSTPLMSEDFPAPLTPVTATIPPSGSSTSIRWRLCSAAPTI